MKIEEWLGQDNQLGMDIWKNKYCQDGEDFEQWLERISGGNREIAQLIREKKFLFGGRILSNRGLENQGRKVSLSNCYVVTPPEDNIESIFECAKKLARTYSYGGGCGVDISGLAPRGAKINNAAKETSGAVSFMELYSLVTELIGQNGRRGALMISIDCSHPDVEAFVDLKTDLNKVTKANISVRINREFMEAVKNNQMYRLHYTREATGETIEKEINARELFRHIAEVNWDYGEPGALFWDRVCEWNLLSNTKEFQFAGVNPCAEEPLPAGGSCLLGSLNLSEFVRDAFTDHASFDFDGLKHAVKVSVRALNEVLEEGLPMHPLPEQRESVNDWRQIGLGIMGLADMLIKMGITYGESEALELCDQIGFLMADTAIAASAMLAKEKGPFPKYKQENILSTPYFQANTSEGTVELVKKYGMRNSQLLTIAPTGTLSTMLGISGGIEPVYANYYERKTESLHGTDVYYKVYTKIVENYMKDFKITDDSNLPEYFVTAMALEYHQRIDMQSVWQRHIDASISSTVNVPNRFTVEETENLYLYAYEKGLKGITIFRDGCRRLGVLSTEETKKSGPVAGDGLKRGEIVLVTDDVLGKKRKLITGCGSLHCIALFDPHTGALLETYLSKGSTGGCNNFMIGLSRMISISARGGIDIYTIIDQLNSTGSCPSYSVRRATHKDTSKGSCCPMAVGNALLDMYNEVQQEIAQKSAKEPAKKIPKPKAVQASPRDKMICPECGEPLVFEGGCNVCKSCGWSKCF
ncbi:adenosylcobalamin-dependent ribonucleoside-diphosphate reductase [Lacrimispora saccharolytica]|nr:adenosylcobalamin-dependent ribonucleoside-diphosphate reductase [Lacrimispora saccharolytica]MBS6706000.1 adenosylcobalamin-dependent ribonucleoside-diphosphate reductase [Lachnospiraceae bacterium]MDM8249267.1 adenosylcobalamin-dependent ribonucleoside-diphosphate reductase [Lacrimispora saccharolytica]